MADEQQLAILNRGVACWNAWQREHPTVRPRLRDADLRKVDLAEAMLAEAELAGSDFTGACLANADLSEADLTGATLDDADLTGADLRDAMLLKATLIRTILVQATLTRADFTDADLTGAKLNEAFVPEAILSKASLVDADLTGANLTGANIRWADLTGAILRRANLTSAQIVGTYLNRAELSECRVYGVAAWDLRMDELTRQHDLVITPFNQPSITVDDLEIAQFIYLLLNNKKIRAVIDAVTSTVVLILGRFTEERKQVLDAIRGELRNRNFTPILFDFDKPASKDLTGTVETLARMARFIIADITDPSSIPHELATIVPFLRTTPVLPLRLAGSTGYSMFDDLSAYRWVLKTYEYISSGALTDALPAVIAPADELAAQLRTGS